MRFLPPDYYRPLLARYCLYVTYVDGRLVSKAKGRKIDRNQRMSNWPALMSAFSEAPPLPLYCPTTAFSPLLLQYCL
eukprot:g43674.t1